MPLLNWQTLQPAQVKDTVFHELDDEQVLGVRIRFFSNVPAEYLTLKTAIYISVRSHLLLIVPLVQELNMDVFEELFKTKAQGTKADLTKIKKVAQKAPSKTSLIDQNKAKNLAITLRKGSMNPSDICTAIETYVLHALHLLFSCSLNCLTHKSVKISFWL